ncbi:MAG: HDOD domain-containing protein [Candidatus Eisenbacteria bacterium]|uniref:HDOD domain-containing protein n=1 Tax=Eiseniibacteriota bacterium TaxID=2212470 RepID=A0A849SR58_UNCEI|nr:HDOD domain-containing protein [Candidatus Eisenbacteria bacterium]
MPGPPTIFVARQPIFDRRAAVHGYELLFRGSAENRFTGGDVESASAINIEQSTAAFGLDALVGERLAFVNLSRGALLQEFYRMLPSERTVIELLESVHGDAEVLEACRELKRRGYRLALDDFTDAPHSQPLLAYADIVKVDLRQTPEALTPGFTSRLRGKRLSLVAEKVETPQEHRRAMAAGYDLFQGYYFCQPEMIETRDLAPSQLSQMRFLAEVSRSEVSFEQLEELFRRDVAMTLRLLRYLNSAAFGWRHEIRSVGHALMLMGVRPLRKWAMMMGFLRLAGDKPHELAITALTRARFAEQLGPPAGLEHHDSELFLTGILSTAEAMLGRSLRDVLTALAVPDMVRTALLDGGSRLGAVLRIVMAYERGDWPTVESVRTECAVDERALTDAYVSSLQWAETSAAA